MISQLQNGFEMAEVAKEPRACTSSRPKKAVQSQYDRMWKSRKTCSKDISINCAHLSNSRSQ